MNPSTDQSCSNCRCWQQKPGNEFGSCRAHPPERVGPGTASFPTTAPGTWCAEWQMIAPAVPNTDIVPVAETTPPKPTKPNKKQPEPAAV